MLTFVRAWFAARRMGLRDKGQTQYVTEGGDDIFTSYKVRVCQACSTRVRVGIAKDGQSVRYCWRCEVITAQSSQDSNGDPDGKEPMPAPENTGERAPDVEDDGQKVIAFPQRH